MSFLYHRKRFVGNGNRFGNVLVGQRSIYEVIVVICEEYAAPDTLGDPFLMKHERRVICDPEIEQRRHSAYMKVVAVLRRRGYQPVLQLCPLFDKNPRAVERLQLVDTGDPAAKGTAESQ